MLIKVAGLGNRGKVREENQDYFCIGPYVQQDKLIGLVIDTESTSFREYGLLVAVADGMGGYSGGELSSRIVLNNLSGLYYSRPHNQNNPDQHVNDLRQCLEITLHALQYALLADPKLSHGGTTIAGLLLWHPEKMAIFHAGDSRVLRSSEGYTRSLTIDHTVAGTEIRAGRMTESEAASIKGSEYLTRSLGLKGNTEIEINADITWALGDTFLIGTDGFHGLGKGISKQNINKIIKEESDIMNLTSRLNNEAVNTDGSDNATSVVIQCLD